MTASAKKPAPVYDVVASPKGFALHRNGQVFKTPADADFILPTLPLAEAIASEWRAQTEKINPASMPLTQLAATAIDIVSKDRKKITAELLNYIGSELLCHRAEDPSTLAAQQDKMWQPLLGWCAKRFDASLQNGVGIMPIVQSPEATTALRRAIGAYDDFRLAGLSHAVDVCGSLVLGLALTEKHLSSEAVFETSELDATFQIQKWGEDTASAKRRDSVRQDLSLCEKWFNLLGS